MSIALISGSLHGNSRREYLVDTDADLENLPECSVPGSTAVSIESGKIMIVNTQGKWQTFGEPIPPFTIEWDGNTEGLAYFDYDGDTMYKVSDRVLALEELAGATLVDGDIKTVINYDECSELDGGCHYYGNVVSCTAGEKITDDGIEFTVPEDGTYFYETVRKLTLPNAK